MTAIAHVSHPYVTVGRMIDLHICNLLAALRSLVFMSFLFADKLLFPACILSLISSCIKFLLFIGNVVLVHENTKQVCLLNMTKSSFRQSHSKHMHNKNAWHRVALSRRTQPLFIIHLKE
jgi:hypothetical protein